MQKILLVIMCFFLKDKLLAQKINSNKELIKIAVAPDYDSVNSIHRLFFGQSYRSLWAAPVTMRIIHIDTEKGGLLPIEKGGGLQTKSLRLKDKMGKEWVLRSIQKYPEKGLPKNLKNTIAKDILQDQVVTGHPYAALTFPVFAAALGIYHTNPEIVFLRADKSLGEFEKEFGNTVLLLEERIPPTIEKAEKTEIIIDSLEQNSAIRVNQHMMLRARLLDLLIGDWDRHEGQWKWIITQINSKSFYEPIPFDHDKIFYNTTGIFPKILSRQSLKENLQGYNSDIRSIDKYNYNNRYFDRYFLHELNITDWVKEIEWVQSHITDDVINQAMHRLPDTIYQLSAKKIINTLKQRRKNLLNEGMQYYRFLSKKIDIAATNQNDKINIMLLSDDSVSIVLSDQNNSFYYKRKFSGKETHEIRIFGLSGQDAFYVNGRGKFPIKIRMIGGNNNDIYTIDSTITSRKKLYIYDYPSEENIIPDLNLARIKLTTDSLYNNFNRKSFKYNKQYQGVTFYFSRDQGLLSGVGFSFTKQGFGKEPFAEIHRFTAGYSTARKSLNFSYNGYFTRLFKKSDMSLRFISAGPYNVSNFFGLGNETTFINQEEMQIDYYRNRFDLATGDIKIIHEFSKNLTISGGPSVTWYGSTQKNNEYKFFKDFNTSHPEEQVYDNRFFAGINATSTIDTRINKLLPAAGFIHNIELKVMKQLTGISKSYGSLLTEFSFYLPIFKDSNLVIANKAGVGTTVGKPVFFQQMQLGGSDNLRGFASNRFTGRSVAYHNVDVRCKLFDFTSYILPGTLGIIGFNDVGRVWSEGENSNKWHHSYGGGIYLVPGEIVLVEAILAHSTEGYYPYISIGFTF